jgi:low temperature requirement protein LtrA
MNFLTDDSIMYGGEGGWHGKKHLIAALFFFIISIALVIIYDRLSESRLSDDLKKVRDEDQSKSYWFRYGQFFGSGIILLVVWLLGFSKNIISSSIVFSILGIQTGLCLSLANPDDFTELKNKYDNIRKK